MLSVKQDLSISYKILSKLGMDDHTYTHLSARPTGADYFYILPFGLCFKEVTEDNLLKVSLDGEILEGYEYQYNRTGYAIHSSIYKSRPDINAIFHLHTPYNVAVSAMEEGLMPISQWALHFYGKISYHEYNSLVLDYSNQLVEDLGKNFNMLLRNHGAITCGTTIQEAMFYSYHLEKACMAQILACSSGRKVVIPSEDICKKSVSDLLSFEEKLGMRDWQAWKRMII